jgi:hypothetical protein
MPEAQEGLGLVRTQGTTSRSIAHESTYSALRRKQRRCRDSLPIARRPTGELASLPNLSSTPAKGAHGPLLRSVFYNKTERKCSIEYAVLCTLEEHKQEDAADF